MILFLEEKKEPKEEIKEDSNAEIKEEKDTGPKLTQPYFYRKPEVPFKEVTIDGVVLKLKFCGMMPI